VVQVGRMAAFLECTAPSHLGLFGMEAWRIAIAFSFLPIIESVHVKAHLNELMIENFIGKLKQFRAIATRYDKAARNFLAAIHLPAAAI
jgi:transposase